MERLDTPDKIEKFVAKQPYCKAVELGEYFDAMGLVIIVKVTLWTKVRCLWSSTYYRMLKTELEVQISRQIILGIDYKLVFEL